MPNLELQKYDDILYNRTALIKAENTKIHKVKLGTPVTGDQEVFCGKYST